MTTLYAKCSVLRKVTQIVRLNFLNIAVYFFTIFISTLFSKRILPHYQLHLTLFLKGLIYVNPLNAELHPICYLLALLAHHFLHVSRIRVKNLRQIGCE